MQRLPFRPRACSGTHDPLDAAGRSDAVVAVVADHGEAFALHPEERWDHGWRVWEETVHVPLAGKNAGTDTLMLVAIGVVASDVGALFVGHSEIRLLRPRGRFQ